MNSYKNHKIKQSKGQALIESILLIPILVIVIVSIFWFSRLVLTKQQLVMAARYGTDMIVYTNMNESEVRNEIRNYLCGNSVKGRRLDSQNLNDKDIKIKIYREPVIDERSVISRFYSFNEVENYSSSVDISYEFAVPLLFSAWEKFIPGNKMAEKIKVSARSEVLAGTGAK